MSFIPPVLGALGGRALFARMAPAIGGRLGAFVEGRTGSSMLGKAATKMGTVAAPWVGMHQGAKIGQEFSQGMQNVEKQISGSSGIATDAMYGGM